MPVCRSPTSRGRLSSVRCGRGAALGAPRRGCEAGSAEPRTCPPRARVARSCPLGAAPGRRGSGGAPAAGGRPLGRRRAVLGGGALRPRPCAPGRSERPPRRRGGWHPPERRARGGGLAPGTVGGEPRARGPARGVRRVPAMGAPWGRLVRGLFPRLGPPGVLRDRRPRRPAVQPPSGRVRGARPVRRALRTRGLCAASSGTRPGRLRGAPPPSGGRLCGPGSEREGGRGRAQSVSTRGSGAGGPAAGKPRFRVAQGRGDSAPARAGGSRLPLESPGELRGRRRLFPPRGLPRAAKADPGPGPGAAPPQVSGRGCVLGLNRTPAGATPAALGAQDMLPPVGAVSPRPGHWADF